MFLILALEGGEFGDAVIRQINHTMLQVSPLVNNQYATNVNIAQALLGQSQNQMFVLYFINLHDLLTSNNKQHHPTS